MQFIRKKSATLNSRALYLNIIGYFIIKTILYIKGIAPAVIDLNKTIDGLSDQNHLHHADLHRQNRSRY